ncbi:MAG: hypothetical protein MJ236_07475 [Clostridia bacterium]|nr:hypothetical protein [Clostridia bacterium]
MEQKNCKIKVVCFKDMYNYDRVKIEGVDELSGLVGNFVHNEKDEQNNRLVSFREDGLYVLYSTITQKYRFFLRDDYVQVDDSDMDFRDSNSLLNDGYFKSRYSRYWFGFGTGFDGHFSTMCWMVQPDGCYYRDSDGFGGEDQEELNAYFLIDDDFNVILPCSDLDYKSQMSEIAELVRSLALRYRLKPYLSCAAGKGMPKPESWRQLNNISFEWQHKEQPNQYLTVSAMAMITAMRSATDNDVLSYWMTFLDEMICRYGVDTFDIPAKETAVLLYNRCLCENGGFWFQPHRDLDRKGKLFEVTYVLFSCVERKFSRLSEDKAITLSTLHSIFVTIIDTSKPVYFD